jgi:hypothetical protein
MSDPLHVIRGRGKPMAFVVTALAVAIAVVADYGAFGLLDLNYFRWYLEVEAEGAKPIFRGKVTAL